MIHIYYLLLLVLTAVGSISATLYGPQLIKRIKQYLTRFKRKPKHTINPSTLVALTQRIEELEQQYKQRQINFKSRVREEVRDYLEHLKTK